jgi:hypothetical protein
VRERLQLLEHAHHLGRGMQDVVEPHNHRVGVLGFCQVALEQLHLTDDDGQRGAQIVQNQSLPTCFRQQRVCNRRRRRDGGDEAHASTVACDYLRPVITALKKPNPGHAQNIRMVSRRAAA